MNVCDLVSGDSLDFTLEETNEFILESLKDLSSNRGGNLQLTMTQDERVKFERKFNYGFCEDLRKCTGADDALTYREVEKDEDGNYVFTTYFKPD